jgi:hypothetical protein
MGLIKNGLELWNKVLQIDGKMRKDFFLKCRKWYISQPSKEKQQQLTGWKAQLSQS